MKKIAFTGTRKGMDIKQIDEFRRFLREQRQSYTFHHGGATGADVQAHGYALSQNRCVRIEIWLPNGAYAENGWGQTRHAKVSVNFTYKTPLERNRLIIAEADILVAVPDEEYEILRSGTWATVRYARAAGIPVRILSPGQEARKC